MVGPRGKQPLNCHQYCVSLCLHPSCSHGSKSWLSMWSSSEAATGSLTATRWPTPLPADKHPQTEASPGCRMSGVRAYQLKQKH